MRYRNATLPPSERDPDLLHQLFFAQQFCLVVVFQLAIIALLAHLFASINHLLPETLTRMRAPSALAALFSALSFLLSESDRSSRKVLLSQIFAVLAALIAATYFFEPAFHIASRIDAFLKLGQVEAPWSRVPMAAGVGYVILALVMLLVRARRPFPSRVADGITSCLCLLVLVLFSEFLFGVAHIPGSSTVGLTSTPTLICLVLLTLVAVFRRSENGMFSLFLGYGIGSRNARWLAPVLLALPFLREVGRARVLNAQLIPAHYATAVMASLATVISFGLLIFLAGRINRMQIEIQDLTLRDELTGLYNVRGFNLLAEQALRLARRAQQPFSVLFVDLDDLKKINDVHGHSAGSASIAEAAQLLNATFRETDVIGRVGGDEFVVAGQFSEESILHAIERLEKAAAQISGEKGRDFGLSLSMGFAVNEANPDESLRGLLARADKAMYDVKRLKKTAMR
jgi:diguanylate cyclase (GGDEF)-like protein